MKLVLSQNARLEIEESKEYYNLQKETLGDEFKRDIQSAIDNIKKSPNLYPNISENIKRTLLHRFPFSIFYTIKEDTILILAVAHQHRRPRY